MQDMQSQKLFKEGFKIGCDLNGPQGFTVKKKSLFHFRMSSLTKQQKGRFCLLQLNARVKAVNGLVS